MLRGQSGPLGDEEVAEFTVGIPRALTYHLHPGLWETFFRELGAEVVLSSSTTERTVQQASRISESEHCLSVKLLDAHVQELVDQVDAVFVPRILSTSPDHIACPKLGAVPDSIRADFGDEVEVLTQEIDVRKEDLSAALQQLGEDLGANASAVDSAIDRALGAMSQAWNDMRIEQPGADERCLLLSHPYNLQNDYHVKPIVEKLTMMDVAVDSVDFSENPRPAGRIKWDASAVMRDALEDLESEVYDGVIQLTSFNCGCDSIVSEFYEEILRDKGIPYMSLILDEHTAIAGIDTRLEAFIDSIRAKKQREESTS